MKNSFLLPILLFFATTVQAQWQQVTQLVSNNIYELYALDQQKLILGVEFADLFVSQNGGMDYDAKDLEPYGYVATVDFEDAMTGYAAGGCYFPTEECHGKTFYKTTDAGQTWGKLHGAPIMGVYQDLVALGNGMVYIIEEFDGLFLSEDGGTSFSPVDLGTIFSNPRYVKIQFLDTQTGFISIQNYNTFPSTSQFIYRTTNAGADWEMIYEDTNGSYAFGDFCFTSPDDGFVLKNNGRMLHTANGGGNWAEILYGEDIESAASILFPTADIGYLTSNLPAGTKGRIYRTEDGGQSWEIDFEKDSVFFQKLSFVDGQNGYVMGKYDQVYRRSGTNGTSHVSPVFNMNIFPNPATNYVEIEGDLPTEAYQLMVNDIVGKILHKSNTTGSKTRINLEDFPSGVYFVKWVDKNAKQMGIGKFVKQ